MPVLTTPMDANTINEYANKLLFQKKNVPQLRKHSTHQDFITAMENNAVPEIEPSVECVEIQKKELNKPAVIACSQVKKQAKMSMFNVMGSVTILIVLSLIGYACYHVVTIQSKSTQILFIVAAIIASLGWILIFVSWHHYPLKKIHRMKRFEQLSIRGTIVLLGLLTTVATIVCVKIVLLNIATTSTIAVIESNDKLPLETADVSDDMILITSPFVRSRRHGL